MDFLLRFVLIVVSVVARQLAEVGEPSHDFLHVGLVRAVVLLLVELASGLLPSQAFCIGGVGVLELPIYEGIPSLFFLGLYVF